MRKGSRMPRFGSEGSNEKFGSDQEVVWQGVLFNEGAKNCTEEDLRNLRKYLFNLSPLLE